MIKKPLILLLITMSICSFRCINPVFPNTDHEKPKEHTPEILLGELMAAYQNRSIADFESLFDDKDVFRFYIRRDTDVEKSLEKQVQYNTVTVSDNDKGFIPEAGNYYVLDYTSEKKIHNNLFNMATNIEFTLDLKKSMELHISDDSLLIWTDPAIITIEAEDLFGPEGKIFNVSKQAFLIKKGNDGKWKICQWYELN